MVANPIPFVFYVDIFIIGLIAVFALATLPRAAARFASAAEWRHGHILRSIRLGSARLRGIRPQISRPYISPEPALLNEKEAGFASSIGHGPGIMSDESYTYVSATHLLRHASTRTLGSVSKLPPHLRAWSSVLPPIGGFLRHRISPGFSLGQALILTIYTAVLAYASFLNSNPFNNPVRMGIVAMSQIPIVYALAAKNNVIGMCVGMGYEKLNYIHRFAGLMLIVLANIHSFGYIYLWTFEGTFSENMRLTPNKMAFVALVAIDVLFFFSLSFWRRKTYNIFFATHVICFIVFLPAVYAHERVTLHYIFAAAGAYGLDHLLRLIKTRIFNARIRPIPDLSLTRIEIPALNAGWRPGQHVRVRVLSSAMGLIGWAEAHPFTIATVAKTPEGLVLMCKKVGGWTNRLYELATVAGYGCENREASRKVLVMLDGPYGGPGHSVFASFSAAMFVVGGSGITFALSAIQDLIQRDYDDSSRVKLIELVWSIQDPCALNPLVPLFSSLIQQSTRTPLRISVHYTRAADVPPAKDFLPPGLTLTAGRPRFGKMLDAVITRTVSYGSGVKANLDLTGVVIGVCGPVGLGDEISQTVTAVDPGRRWAVGGIEIHEETFGW